MKKKIIYSIASLIIVIMLFIFILIPNFSTFYAESTSSEKKFIKYVEFNVPYSLLKSALNYDINYYGKKEHESWIKILAYISAKQGGNFGNYKTNQFNSLAEKLKNGDKIDELANNIKYYNYYLEAYTAILSGFVGEFEIEEPIKDKDGEKQWVKKYGLMAFSPIAKGYDYNHYDDFGDSRSYGYKREHLGNDLMGQIGTPIIAVEGGIVEALGWNRYGGWRIGIRSFDNKRYYYYAHLRKNFPFNKSLKIGSTVKAGDVIGYLGRTGYSYTENTNNITVPHLHFGLELIFDESQKESNNEIWINVYNIIKLLNSNRSKVIKNLETKEYTRVYNIKY